MKSKSLLAVTVLAVVTIASAGCDEQADGDNKPTDAGTENKEVKPMSLSKESFASMPDGRQVHVYTLENSNGIRAKVINYGAILVSLEVPGRDGETADIVTGFSDPEDFIKRGGCVGATIGRYANRIGKAKFTLDGTEYTLLANNGENHLHGGKKSFDQVLWEVEDAAAQDDKAWVKMHYLSVDGEEGYPGNLDCWVTYTLTNDDELAITYEAATDKPTVVNLTNHSYFNLAGEGNGDVLDHKLTIYADHFTPVDEGLIPTGEIRSVEDSPMNFTQPKTVGSRIDQVGGGYDHNYVLRGQSGEMKHCATVYEPDSGRVMDVYTTEPGVQLYTANHFNGKTVGKSGKPYVKHGALCLETQHFPDSPNKPDFPSTVLRPGEKFESRTVHKFSVR